MELPEHERIVMICGKCHRETGGVIECPKCTSMVCRECWDEDTFQCKDPDCV